MGGGTCRRKGGGGGGSLTDLMASLVSGILLGELFPGLFLRCVSMVPASFPILSTGGGGAYPILLIIYQNKEPVWAERPVSVSLINMLK